MLQPEQGWRGHSRGIPLEYLQVFKQVLLPLVSQERLREGPSFCQEGSSRRKSVLLLLALLLSNKLTCCVCFGPREVVADQSSANRFAQTFYQSLVSE